MDKGITFTNSRQIGAHPKATRLPPAALGSDEEREGDGSGSGDGGRAEREGGNESAARRQWPPPPTRD